MIYPVDFFVSDKWLTADEIHFSKDFSFFYDSGSNLVQNDPWRSGDFGFSVSGSSSWTYESGLFGCGETSYLRGTGIDNLPSDYAVFVSYVCDQSVGAGISDGMRYLTLYSSLSSGAGPISGYDCGILETDGTAFIRYYDERASLFRTLKTNIQCETDGIFYVGNYSNLIEVGAWNQTSGSFIKERLVIDSEAFTNSNEITIGKSPLRLSYFTGGIDSIFICDSNHISSMGRDLAVVSGFCFGVQEDIITGSISGQTGIIYGDIISMEQCSYTFSGFLKSVSTVGQKTGMLFLDKTQFSDFNNNIFNDFSGYYSLSDISGVSYYPAYKNVCLTVTGFDSYEYGSGYQFNYQIKNSLSYLQKANIYYDHSDSVSFNNENFLDGDILSFVFFTGDPSYTYSAGGNSFDYKMAFSQYFGPYSSVLNGATGVLFYFNGILQQKSDTASGYFVNGLQEKQFTPYSGDFYFDKNLGVHPIDDYSWDKYNNLFADLIESNISYLEVTGFSSGQAVSGLGANKAVFFNGQLLSPSFDYSGSSFKFSGKNGDLITYVNIGSNAVITGAQLSISGPGATVLTFDPFINKDIFCWRNGVRIDNSMFKIFSSNFSNFDALSKIRGNG